jgi:hypothetical protein
LNTANWHFDLSPNIGNIDTIARYTAGATLIGVLLVAAPTPVGWISLLPLIAIPLVVSAIIGWDPLYALFQKQPTFSTTKPAADLMPGWTQDVGPRTVKRKAA